MANTITVTDAATVNEFIRRYYRRSRFMGEVAAYGEAAVFGRFVAEFDEFGSVLLSHHDSVTGECVRFGVERAARKIAA